MHRRSFIAAPLVFAGSTARAETATLRFLWWGGGERHKRTLQAIAAFEAQNPGVKIKPEYMGTTGYLEKLTMQMAGGTEPDIMQINWAWLAMFSRHGDGFYDLNQQKSQLAMDQFPDEELRMGSVQGKLNGLSPSYTARLFVWNQASFARAGLSLPRTWDDLFAAGPVFQKKLGEQAYPIDGEPYDMLLLAQAYIFQKHGTPYVHASGKQVAMSPSALLEWVQLYKRLVDAHVATPLRHRASLGGAEKPLEQQPDWVVGNWAGNYAWDTTLRLRQSTLDKQQKLDIGEFLTLPNARNSGMFGRPAMLFSVSKRCKHPAIAARFLNFLLTDPEAARILALSRGVPSTARAFNTLQQAGLLPPLELKAYLQIKAQRDAGRIELPSPKFEDARFRKFMREVFERVSYDKITEQEAATRLLIDGNALLARIK
ncbi:ABC transporter substrate-binding protein [Aquabacterium sp.]|uniref:ABC transporter substrate-binding protein n=1 Tax=Aquabacterium sp. TaxID=1872578 RepID=UPI002B8C9E54|nr:ABC transporter substrate-binding protein [Aquabacterium sp.]HSW07442.1 ABC transporter substrate-binding protein [Aquabacterium sp.]